MLTQNKQQNSPCVRCGWLLHFQRTTILCSCIAHHLLCTNEPPQSACDNDEAAFLCEEVEHEHGHGHGMLASVDKDIATLQVSLSRLEEKEQLVQKFINDHAVILSPFRHAHVLSGFSSLLSLSPSVTTPHHTTPHLPPTPSSGLKHTNTPRKCYSCGVTSHCLALGLPTAAMNMMDIL